MSDASAIRVRPAAVEDLPAVLALYAQPDLHGYSFRLEVAPVSP